MYIHTYTHIHRYIHIHTHTYINTHIHTHTYIHRYIQIYIHTHIHTFIHVHTYTHAHKYIHTYLHTHTDIHTYIDTHTYIHTYTQTHTHITIQLPKFCSYPELPVFRYRIIFLKVSRFGPFLRATYRWRWSWSISEMILTRKTRRTRGKNRPIAFLYTTNLRWTDLWLNSGLRIERRATNRLSHCSVKLGLKLMSVVGAGNRAYC
jgi:hypothetical protein